MSIVTAAAFVWIGRWATAPQHWSPGRLQNFNNHSVRLIVHTSARGSKARIRVSNAYGDLTTDGGGSTKDASQWHTRTGFAQS